MHRSVPFALAALIFASAACTPAADAGAADAQAVSPEQAAEAARSAAAQAEVAASAATPAGTTAAPAPTSGTPAEGVLLDYRDSVLPKQELPKNEQRALVTLVDPSINHPAAGVTSRVDGAFTTAGKQQQAIIVVPEGTSTIDPFPKPPTIAVLEQGKVVARHTFADTEGSWQWILKAADVDGDGVDELLLGAGWMQMGESGEALLVASLAGGQYRQVEIMQEVAHDDCEAKSESGGGKASADVVSARGGKLVRERYEAPCPVKGGKEGWAERPKPQDYKPAAG